MILQAAALPVLGGKICLVTNTSGRRWILPKGHVPNGASAPVLAACEAWEEAGLIGILRPRAIGSYRYEKAGRSFEVVLFLMDVTTVVKDWPESRRRSRHWLRPGDAVARVRERGLRKLIRKALAAESVALS